MSSVCVEKYLAFAKTNFTKGEATMSTFSQRLEELLIQYDMNKSQLARRLGVAVSTVHRWFERGSTPNHVTVSRVARIFGVDEKYLLAERGQPSIRSIVTCKS